MMIEKIRYTRYGTRNAKTKGTALLVVLFIVMAITILSLGFLWRSDVELACGHNMILRTQMDYLAESGLEHAKGLILNPQDIDSEYWTGDEDLQLEEDSSDYYDVEVICDPNDRCNYTIDCNSYRRLPDGNEIGFSGLTAGLRLDPVIALWTGSDTAIWNGFTVFGDVYCYGSLINDGSINGDAFANNSPANLTGQIYAVDKLLLDWPAIDVNDFKDRSDVVDYRPGDSTLAGNSINRMLLVDGNLVVSSTNNEINPSKNLPALYVKNNLIIEKGADLQIAGLTVVGKDIHLGGDSNLIVNGGLFIYNEIIKTAADSSGNNAHATLYNGPLWQPSDGKIGGALRFDGSDDYAEVQDESLFDITDQITVSAWIKVNAFNRSSQAIVTKGDSAWRIQRWSNTNRIEFACTGLTHNPPYGSIMGNKNVNDGQWHHVAGVYDGSRIYLYIDGTCDVNDPSSGNIRTNNYKVLIGENSQMRNRYWNGWIDDVRVYDRGLSAEEINIIKEGGAASDLIVNWKFDETDPNVTITVYPTKTAVLLGPQGAEQRWGQAAGAFYRSIRRK